MSLRSWTRLGVSHSDFHDLRGWGSIGRETSCQGKIYRGKAAKTKNPPLHIPVWEGLLKEDQGRERATSYSWETEISKQELTGKSYRAIGRETQRESDGIPAETIRYWWKQSQKETEEIVGENSPPHSTPPPSNKIPENQVQEPSQWRQARRVGKVVEKMP
ncbi:MAG: hypothetical protein C4576_19370 [Desulfobacteraceae bacterium]|nr:MAG: hypothetical protein C4576_19370 [Desulfobacteraceae bacterium]